jgi:alpha-L-arabinofuranosidase
MHQRHFSLINLSVLICAGLALSCPISASAADTAQLTVHIDRPGVKISPMLYGLMTEEINFSYDGGLYGELIRNRAFKDRDTEPAHWSLLQTDGAEGKIELDSTNPVNATALTKSLRLEITKVPSGGRVGIANDGYWGIPVHPNTTYRASFYAKASADFKGPLTISIESNNGAIAASAAVPPLSTEWKKYELTLTTGQVGESADNRFVISADSPGTIWFSLVSLFPPTFNDRPNGTRIDIMERLRDMHPAFLRFPGGNYLEGNDFNNRFDWKTTIGPLEKRPGHKSPWGYRSSDGLGLLEFLQWCEDLHMQPVLAVFAGFCLNGRYVATGDDLKPHVQDALDEIEYVTGDASTTWGSQRAADGHPAPFNLTYVEIGNEDSLGGGARTYEERFAAFYDAIKAKYPQLQIIATMPIHDRQPDVVDDHFYRSARQMQRDVHHYDPDKTLRNGPKIFIGEWATKEGTPTPNMNAALGDAAWMTGMERNSDLVIMAAYAPLLVNVNPGGKQWSTNLIGYNALTSFGSPSYYAQAMFSRNRGDTALHFELTQPSDFAEQKPVEHPHGSIGLATWNTVAEYKNVKVASGDKVLFQSEFDKNSNDWKPTRGSDWSLVDGAYRQSAQGNDRRSFAGDTDWTDYTLTLQARKISGTEGFMVIFHAPNRNNLIRWNIGGWANTITALEQVQDNDAMVLGDRRAIRVDPDRWYNIRIELQGPNIKCFLDDELVTQAVERVNNPPTLFAAASRDDSTGDVIVKLVNAADHATPLQFNLQGANNIASQAQLEVLSGNPPDVNFIDNPKCVYPQLSTIEHAAASFMHELPAYSISVLRFHTH